MCNIELPRAECLLAFHHSNSSPLCPHTQSCQCQSTLQHNKPWIHMSRRTVHAYWVVSLNYHSQFSLHWGHILAQKKFQSQGRSLSQTAQTFCQAILIKCGTAESVYDHLYLVSNSPVGSANKCWPCFNSNNSLAGSNNNFCGNRTRNRSYLWVYTTAITTLHFYTKTHYKVSLKMVVH